MHTYRANLVFSEINISPKIIKYLLVFLLFLWIIDISVNPLLSTINNGDSLELSSNYSRKYIQEDKRNVAYSRRPFPFDSECKNFSKKLYNDYTFNTTALVSYPRSGNTWLRHLIELSSGIYTGSIYFDVDLMGSGFLGEKENWDSGSTIVQKSHSKYDKRQMFSRAILLLRDPYHSIASFVEFLQSGHKGSGSPAVFRRKGWSTYALGQTYSWISLAKSWLESGIPVLVVHYEILKLNTTSEMLRICEYLEIHCPYLQTRCFKKHQEGSFHRHSKFKATPRYTPFMSEKINGGINFLNSLLIRLGHRSLPLELYQFYKTTIQDTTIHNSSA